jgi:DNA-binding GntR family transcriptional regulator
MNWSYREPTLGEMLSDSLVKLVMKADGVDADELEAMLRRVAASRPKEKSTSYFPSHRRFHDVFVKAAC